MRTRHISRLVALLLLVAVAAPAVGPRRAEPGWLLELSLDLDSPDAIATFMLRSFSFRHDRDLYGVPERFAPPAEFLARGAGDCDDWAWFAAEALRERGYRTWMVSVWRHTPDGAGNSGHMVAAYLDRDGWGYVSTEGNVPAHAASLAGLASTVSRDWDSFSIWRQTGRPDYQWSGWRPSVWVPRRDEAPRLFGGADWLRLRLPRAAQTVVRLDPPGTAAQVH